MSTEIEFPLKPAGYVEKYEGKTVEFLHDVEKTMFRLQGKFIVRQRDDREFVEIDFIGPLRIDDPPERIYRFKLQQEHVDSIRPGSPGRSAFLMEIPLLERNEIRSTA
jgi:hypothetical protein